jgi:hypothetical protein
MPRPVAPRRRQTHIADVASANDSFPESVAELRAELERLKAELKQLDSAGNRAAALRVIGRMIATQKAFMSQWPTHRPEDVPKPG